jgi:hypothetical protein
MTGQSWDANKCKLPFNGLEAQLKELLVPTKIKNCGRMLAECIMKVTTRPLLILLNLVNV